MLVGRPMVKTDLCIVAHGSRQQGEGVFDGDSPLYNVLTQTFQAVLTVRRGQVQQPWRSRDTDSNAVTNTQTNVSKDSDGDVRVVLTNSILRRQLHIVCVKELEEGAVHWVGELVYFYHLLHVFIPVGLEHGSEVFTPCFRVDTHVIYLYFNVSWRKLAAVRWNPPTWFWELLCGHRYICRRRRTWGQLSLGCQTLSSETEPRSRSRHTLEGENTPTHTPTHIKLRH